ncbi:GtrA family protein [Nocardia sp. NPDC006630]|uniref:GtrA family protein n=1 Tax=Nocardia sp. NPDC006630 TaxID=3157181 RepID=UPI0033B3243A
MTTTDGSITASETAVPDGPGGPDGGAERGRGSVPDSRATPSDRRATLPESGATLQEGRATSPVGNATLPDGNATRPVRDMTLPGAEIDSGQLAALEPDGAPAGPLLRLVRRQEVAFALVGGLNTLMGMVLTIVWLTVLEGVVSKDVAAALSVALAYAVGMVVAFVMHRTLVFRVRGHLMRDFVAFVGVNLVGMVLNMALLQFAVSVLHTPSKPAAVVVMGLVAFGSFFGHRHISFRRSPHDAELTPADR